MYSASGGETPEKPHIDLLIVLVLNLTLFEVGLIANSIGAVIPDAIQDLRLNYTTAALLPFTYFISYLFVSIPAGVYAERVSTRAVVLGSFVLVSMGLALFALYPHYSLILLSLFIVGCGLSAVQVPLFPMLRSACGPERLAFFTAMTSLSYGLGSILSPLLYSGLVARLKSSGSDGFPIQVLAALTRSSYPWVSVYWLFSVVALLTLFVLYLVRLPSMLVSEDERSQGVLACLSVLKRRDAMLYALGVFAYVACEQVCSNWLSQFLKDLHGIAPDGLGASVLSWYWALLTFGCLIGMAAIRYFDSARILFAWSILAAVAYSASIFGPTRVAMVAFPLTGMFISVLWPIIVALALNSVPVHHGPLMGVLMSSTIGGAVGPLAVGSLADAFGLRPGMMVLYPAFAYMAWLAVWSRKGASRQDDQGRPV